MSAQSAAEVAQAPAHLSSEEQPHIRNDRVGMVDHLTSDMTQPSAGHGEAIEVKIPKAHPFTSYAFTPSSFSSNTRISQDLSDYLDMEDQSAYMDIDDEGRKKPPAQSQVESVKFDPKTLLNPRAAVKPEQVNGSSTPDSLKRSSSSRSPARPPAAAEPQFDFSAPPTSNLDNNTVDNDDAQTNGMGAMLEQMHGIKERDFRSSKRQKTGHDTNSASWSASKGSEISKHFDELRKNEAEKGDLSPPEELQNVPSGDGPLNGALSDEMSFTQQDANGSETPDEVTNALESENLRPDEALVSDSKTSLEILSILESEDNVSKIETKKAEQVVDLTTDADDEEDVQITGSVTKIMDPEEEEVCFGAVDRPEINAHKIPAPHPKAKSLMKNQWPTIPIKFGKPMNNYRVIVYDGENKDFGTLSHRVAYGVAPLMKANYVRLQGRVSTRKRGPYELPGNPLSQTLGITLVLYGKRKHAKKVSGILAEKKILLARPLMFDRDVEYVNPYEEDNKTKLRVAHNKPLSNPAGLVRTIEEIESSVMKIFDSSQEAKELPEMEANHKIIKTPLLAHQKQALHFMTTREWDEDEAAEVEDQDGNAMFRGNSLWRIIKEKNGFHYYNVVGGFTQQEKPSICRGGILADMMGLGKTLSVLSLCASTTNKAARWAASAPLVEFEDVTLKNLKSTLLIAPLSVVANWEEQIKLHTKPGTFRFYVYHSKNREADLNKLGEYDIIITTYSIVSSELHGLKSGKKKKYMTPFHAANFFRIVLDEAHAIREPTTLQSRAICMLNGPRRWGITGTPIQNKLEDFGSLLRFIRLAPFDMHFRSTIIAPFKMAEPNVIPKLRMLVDSVTLRRTKERLNLPKRLDLHYKLRFREEEEKMYRWFAVEARMKIKAMGLQEQLGGKRWGTFLRTILACRSICDALDLLNEEDLKLVQGSSGDQPIDLDVDTTPAVSERTAYEMLSLFEESDLVSCARCKEPSLLDHNKDPTSETPGIIGYLTDCLQIVCTSCISDFKKEIKEKYMIDDGSKMHCPFCELEVAPRFFELTHEGFERAKVRKDERKGKPQRKIDTRYNGPSSKTSALMAMLEESRQEDVRAAQDEEEAWQRNEEELQASDEEEKEHNKENIATTVEKAGSELARMPNKSVIFSCWTSYLDLIEMALDEAEPKFSYARLDGKMSREKRKANLDSFNSDPTVTVLLASIGTGGLGLNLTVANSVYIMEPQWNPAAEAQAIDRVHRLGQKRDVKCVRFTIEGSIEDGVMEMQRKKLDLAELSMTKRKMDKRETAKERLKSLAGLFK